MRDAGRRVDFQSRCPERGFLVPGPRVSEGQSQGRDALPRTLTLFDLVWIVVGTVIGSGIFIVPAVTLRQNGGYVGPSLVAWTIAGALSCLGALTYAELATLKPEAGGLYVYIRDAFGRLPAFLYGWTLLVVIGTGSIATLAVAFGIYLRELLPLPIWMGKATAVLVIALICALNVRGVRQTATAHATITALKVGAILVMCVALLALGKEGPAVVARMWPEGAVGPLLPTIGLSVVGGLWAYEGWHYCSFSAGEALHPQRDLPRALTLGLAILVIVYTLANLGYVLALGPQRATGAERVAAAATSVIAGPVGGKLVTIVILLSILSATNGTMLTAPRAYFAMARDGLLFSWLGSLHREYATPAPAIVLAALWSSILALSGTFEQLLTSVVFSAWIFYGLGAAAVFVFRRRMPGPRTFSVPGYPVTPALFIAAAGLLVANTTLTRPAIAAWGAAVVALGLPAYLLWGRRSLGDVSGEPREVPRA
jgi:APA family basic amino acid/polyamine antiporter